MIPRKSLAIAAGMLCLADIGPSAPPKLAVFRDANVPLRNSAPSDPERLAQLARDAGWDVAFVTGVDLADPKAFSRGQFEIVVLPYGESFPIEAVDNFRAFLKAGGGFFSTGGYAFNFLYSMKGAEAGENLLRNSGFEDGMDGWRISPEKPAAGAVAQIETEPSRAGRRRARLAATPPAPKGFYTMYQEIAAPAPGTRLRFSAQARARGLRDGSAYLALSFWREDGTRFENQVRQSEMIGADVDWTPLAVVGNVPKGAARVRAAVVLNAFGEAWFDDADLRATERVVLNTRLGHDTGSGILSTNPDQIGVFDDSYPLAGVAEARPDEGQFILDPGLRIGAGAKHGAPMEGWAASAVVGVSPEERYAVLRRWIPVLNGYDESGEMAGPVLSIVYNLAPPFRGSSWAFTGVVNRDLFAPDNPEMGKAFVCVLDAMRRKVFLGQPKTDLYCYRQGEAVEIRAPAYNLGPDPVDVRLELRVLAEDSGAVVAREVFDRTLPAGGDSEFAFRWSPAQFDDDFHEVVSTLEINGRTVDRSATGFVVWDLDVLKHGFPLQWRDNYFRAGERPVFLTGTNHYFTIWDSDEETPLAWQRSFARLRDNGVHAMRILHLTRIIGPVGHDFDWTHPPEESMRRLDAVVQMCQKHQIALFLSLHEGVSVVLDDGQLERERQWAEFVSRRYGEAAGILYDVQNEPTVLGHPDKHMAGLYREFLKSRYKTDEGFAKAHGQPGLKIESAELPGPNEPWASRAGVDRQDFSVESLRRWVRANAQGVRDGAPGKPVTVGYLPNGTSADMWLASPWTDFSNLHAYVTYGDLRNALKFIDQRSAGRGLSIGEFGFAMNPGLNDTARQVIGWTKAHWMTPDSAGKAIDWYLSIPLQTFGLGGSMACNWHAYDPDSFIFSFGLLHNGQRLPREILKAFRAAGLLLRNFAPQYEAPEVCYVVPDNHRNGGDRAAVVQAVRTGMDMLLGCGVEFAAINESSLASLPANAKFLIWPIPFCPDDEVVERLKAYVEAGGRLLITGDFSYDRWRQRSRTERLPELAGVEFVRENYPNIGHAGGKPVPCEIPLAAGKAALEVAPCIQIRPAGARVLLSAGGQPLLCEFSLGKGKTYFTPEPFELRHTWKDTALYEYALERESVPRLPVRPLRPETPVLRQPTRDGEEVFVFCNRSDETATMTLAPAPAMPTVRISVAPRRESLVALNKSGEIIAAGVEGECVFGESRMGSPGRLMLIAADKRPLTQTRRIVVFLLGATEFSLSSFAAWRDPLAEIGEIVDGRWKPMGRARLWREGHNLKIEAAAVHRFRILLIAESSEIEPLRKAVADWTEPPRE